MIQFGVKSNLDQLTKAFDKMASGQVPFATSLALNRTAQLAKDTLRHTMERVFDRPKPFTLNSLFVRPANKSNLVATVGHKDASPVNKYLRWEIEGGQRARTGLERLAASLGGGGKLYLVPAKGMRLDPYGNVPAGVLRRIVSGLQSRGGDIFAVRPGSKSHLTPGIYQRSGKRAIALMIFVSHAHYRKLYDLPGVVERVVNAEFGKQFAAAMDYALASARVKL